MMGNRMMGGGMSGMNKFGMNQRMMQMQGKNPFARVPGMYPLKPVPKGVDGGHIGNLHPNQLPKIYGSLGQAPKMPARKPGEALKIQLLGAGAGTGTGTGTGLGTGFGTGTGTTGNAFSMNKGFGTGTNKLSTNFLSSIRRRLGEEMEMDLNLEVNHEDWVNPEDMISD